MSNSKQGYKNLFSECYFKKLQIIRAQLIELTKKIRDERDKKNKKA